MRREYSKAIADYGKAIKLDPGIDAARILLKEAVKISKNVDADGDQNLVCHWVAKGKAKRKECRTEREWAKL